jgi:alanine dehydrogenase
MRLSDCAVIDYDEVLEALPMERCIAVMERAFRALHRGDAVQPLRMAMWQSDRRGGVAAMPAYLGDPKVIGAKLITVFPANREIGMESHQGVVVLHDTEDGRLLAIVDASAITGLRTAAVSGLATRLMAREDSGDLAILGSGAQAHFHLDAMCAVRPIRRVRIWSRTPENARKFVEAHQERCHVPIAAVDTPRDAVSGADIICTVSASREPILEGAWLKPGAHINAAGASVPGFRELDFATVLAARVVVDRRESALNEADDLRVPLREGAIAEDHIVAELADVVSGAVEGRTSESEITMFKSLGLAIEDLAAAHGVYEVVSCRSKNAR